MGNETNAPSVGQLGYLGFEVRDPSAWETFATRVLGLSLADRLDTGGFTLGMDSHAHRFIVEPGDADDVFAFGWEVASENVLDTLTTRLRAAGVRVQDGTAEEARRRKVTHLVKLEDPSGHPLELYVGPELAPRPFASEIVTSHFVADEVGLGHAVVSSKDKNESVRFYSELLGFRLSDEIRCEFFGFDVDIAFFHVNRRHHSFAVGGPQKKRIHHFMLEVASLDDVGLCFDRALKSGLRIMQTIGRHPNDRMVSYYAQTPSGFQFEYGYGGREIDDATWEPTTYDRISEWGHHPPGMLAPPPRRPQ